jgi:hypothetical protein
VPKAACVSSVTSYIGGTVTVTITVTVKPAAEQSAGRCRQQQSLKAIHTHGKGTMVCM